MEMEYKKPKLNFSKYKNDSSSTLLKSIAREIVNESRRKFNLFLNYDLALWLVNLMHLNQENILHSKSSFDRATVDDLIAVCLEIIAGMCLCIFF